LNFSNRSVLAVRILLVVGCLVTIAATVWRTIDRYDVPEVAAFDASRQGQFDFHNGIYFPAVAFDRGYNPYGKAFAENFPVSRQIPPYSPLTLLIHWPLAWLSLSVAEVVYFLISLGLCIALAVLTVRGIDSIQDKLTWSIAILLLVLASRAGHTTLFTGYFTLELVVGSLVALRYAVDRPILSAIGIALASIKPNIGIPLIILMAARGNWRAVLYAAAFCGLGALIPIVMLLQNSSVEQLIADVRSSDEAHVTDYYELPVNTWTRVDALAIASKWMGINPGAPVSLLVMLGLLVVPCIGLRKLKALGDSSGALSFSGTLVIVSSMVAIYHHIYDTLLLIPVAVALALDSRWQRWFSMPIRGLLALGLLLPPWNYLSAEQVLNRLAPSEFTRQLTTSLSGVVLLACCVLLCYRSFRTINKKTAGVEPSGLLAK
jgi:Glycosyltransferase family 87